jgi:hypothetical protein
MRTTLRAAILTAASMGLFLIAGPAFAHHGYAQFDFDKTITLKGTVTKWELINPHSLLSFDVKDDKGKVSHWMLEQAAPAMMFRSPVWNSKTLQPGDEIEVSGNPARNGSSNIRSKKLVRLRDGKVLQDSTGKASQAGVCLDGVTFDADGLPHPCTE